MSRAPQCSTECSGPGRQRQRGALNRELCRARLDALDWERPAVVMERAVDQGALSGRGFDRVRRVARTIADLGETATVGEVHVAEALAFRGTW